MTSIEAAGARVLALEKELEELRNAESSVRSRLKLARRALERHRATDRCGRG